MKSRLWIGLALLAALVALSSAALAAPSLTCRLMGGLNVCWNLNQPPSGTRVEGVPAAGQVKVWYKYPSHKNPIRIFLSNGTITRYFDMNQPSSGLALSLNLAQGETLLVGACDIYYGGNPTSFSQCQYPAMGWQERVSDWVCQAHPNPYGRGSFDFSDLEAAVEAQGLPIFSRQCWGDYQEDPSDVDFNDFVLILSYERTFSGVHGGAGGTVTDPGSCRAAGWARYDQDPSRDLRIRVLVDQAVAASSFADQYRPDLASICPGGTCAYAVDLWGLISPGAAHTVLVQAQNFITGEWFRLPGSPKTLTCLASSTPTPLPTPTLIPTEPAEDDPLEISLSVAYSHLVLYGPKVGQPTQTLTGIVSGGSGPYAVTIYLRSPSDMLGSHLRSASADFVLDAGSSADPYLGTQEQGTWTAWAVAEDGVGNSRVSPSVTWEVDWWPVHGRP